MISNAYGKDAFSRSQVFEWHTRFREGRQDVHDDQRSGRQSTSHSDTNVQKVGDLPDSDRRFGIRAIAEGVRLDKNVVYKSLTEDMSMRKICAQHVPKHLTGEQKERRLPVANEMLDRQQIDPELLERVIA